MELLNYLIPAGALLVAWASFRLTVLLQTKNDKDKRRKAKADRLLRKVTIVLAVLLVIGLSIAAFGSFKRWKMRKDEQAIKGLVRESQTYEIVLYTNPQAFNRSQLDPYWMPDSKATRNIDCAVQRLLDKGLHYGTDSKVESFDFDSVQISGDQAEASTREAWYLPLYSMKDNSRVTETRAEQSWNAKYYLKRINGKWLIQDTTLPYKPCPPKKS